MPREREIKMAELDYKELAVEDQRILKGLKAVMTKDNGVVLHTQSYSKNALEQINRWIEKQTIKAQAQGCKFDVAITEVQVKLIGSLNL